jgi:hypothetical protein
VPKPAAQLLDDDPFAHLTANERFALAVERRDALIPDRRPFERRRRGYTAQWDERESPRRTHCRRNSHR